MQRNVVNSGNAKSLLISKEECIHLHWERGLSLTEIGQQKGVTASAIVYWFKKYNLKGRARLQEVLFEPSPTLSYVFGVLHGDGFLAYNRARKGYDIILSVIDESFARSFGRALNILGLRAGVLHIPAQREGWKRQWKVTSTSKGFHSCWNFLNRDERLDFGLRYPRDFIRGLYESEGTIFWKRTSLELAIVSVNAEMQKRVFSILDKKEFKPKMVLVPLFSGKTLVRIHLYRNLDVKRFVAWITPVIKYAPRSKK